MTRDNFPKGSRVISGVQRSLTPGHANVRLVLEYDGSAFHGWQAQSEPGPRTVEAEVTRAIAMVTRERVKLLAAGRTDAGAHSLGQTVNFKLDADIEPQQLRRSLNGVLPADIAVVSADLAPQSFHSRFSAHRRRYRYLVENRQARSAVLRHRAWHVRRPLDLGAMRQAAGGLLGRNDLGAFGRDPAGRNNVRNLEQLSIRRLRGAADGQLLAFELAADAFLYGMVRRMVGFLVEVGLELRAPADSRRLLLGQAVKASRVAPAHGLYQLAVEYGAAW
jgi:tRNA pseudouridine38-40 synthase